MTNPSPNGMFDQCPNFVSCSLLAINRGLLNSGCDVVMGALMPDSPAALTGESAEPPLMNGDDLALLANAPAILDAALMEGLATGLPASERCIGCWATGLEVEITTDQIAGLPEVPEPPQE